MVDSLDAALMQQSRAASIYHGRSHYYTYIVVVAEIPGCVVHVKHHSEERIFTTVTRLNRGRCR